MRRGLGAVESNVIKSFRGEHDFLSNFFQASVEVDGVLYPTVEHAFQAAKTLNVEHRRMIQQARTAGEAKKLGRRVALRRDWEEVKLGTLEGLVRQKFSNPGLSDKLASTFPANIVEGNYWHDTFYGVCFCERHDGTGENHLGIILEVVRLDCMGESD